MPNQKAIRTKYLPCSNCKKMVEVGQSTKTVLCEDCTEKYMREAYNQEMKGGKENMVENKVVAKKVPAKTSVPKAEKVDKKPKFGPEVEAKVIKLFKEGKKFTEISKELGGSPAVPKIKRIIAASGAQAPKKKE